MIIKQLSISLWLAGCAIAVLAAISAAKHVPALPPLAAPAFDLCRDLRAWDRADAAPTLTRPCNSEARSRP